MQVVGAVQVVVGLLQMGKIGLFFGTGFELLMAGQVVIVKLAVVVLLRPFSVLLKGVEFSGEPPEMLVLMGLHHRFQGLQNLFLLFRGAGVDVDKTVGQLQ